MPLIVHFKRPAGWNLAIRIHYWDTAPADPATMWPGLPMTAEPNDWYVYTFPTAIAASIVFNDGAGRETGNLRREANGWFYSNNSWYSENPEMPAIPVIRASPRGQLYDQPQTVTLESGNAEDAIWYTMDGSEPWDRTANAATATAQRYQAPLQIAVTTTMLAVGINSAGQVGQTRSFAYTIDPNADLQRPEVTASHPSGTYAFPFDLVFTITDNRPAPVAVYYTTDGSQPTTSSPAYITQGSPTSGMVGPPLTIGQPMQVKLLVIDAAGNETRRSFYYNIGISKHRSTFARRRSISLSPPDVTTAILEQLFLP
jgi:hypothetical protein